MFSNPQLLKILERIVVFTAGQMKRVSRFRVVIADVTFYGKDGPDKRHKAHDEDHI
jgi:hypothetical protein